MNSIPRTLTTAQAIRVAACAKCLKHFSKLSVMALSSFSVILRRVIDYLQLTVIGLVKTFPLEMDCWWCKELNHLLIAVNRISGF
jgi:phage FluMu protein Com